MLHSGVCGVGRDQSVRRVLLQVDIPVQRVHVRRQVEVCTVGKVATPLHSLVR
jgi:hypothetical protein